MKVFKDAYGAEVEISNNGGKGVLIYASEYGVSLVVSLDLKTAVRFQRELTRLIREMRGEK